MSRADVAGLILALLLLIFFLIVALYDIVYGEKTKTEVKREVTILLQQAKVASVMWGLFAGWLGN